MKELFSDMAFRLYFDEENQIIIQIWNGNSGSLLESQIKERLIIFLEKTMLHRPSRLLIDLKECNYTISPQLFFWIKSKIINPAQKSGITRTAIIRSDDFITSLFSEKIFENRSLVDRRFFSEISEAIHWLSGQWNEIKIPEIQTKSWQLLPK